MGPHDPLLTIIKKRKMQFYGHTNRAGNLGTTIMQGSVDGKRGRGRPRTTWLKNIVDWTGLAINDLHTYSMDRQKWKKTIDAVAHDAPTTATVTPAGSAVALRRRRKQRLIDDWKGLQQHVIDSAFN